MQIPFDYTVEDVVRMGRYRMRRRGLFEAENREDGQAVRDALETVGLWELRNRTANTLSGGQQQRVFLARVFAQQPEIVMLDEPTNHLDLSSQIELMQQLRLYGSQPNQTGHRRVPRFDAGADAGRAGDFYARRADSQAGRVFGHRVAVVFAAGLRRRCAGASG